jgi:RND family efflux transporter MFP subunit
LVLREPQVAQAEAELAAAEAELARAELDLDRTRVSLPFDGVVVSKSTDLGQYVTAGRVVATVYGTRVVEVSVPLPNGELEWFDVPGRAGRDGPRAEVRAAFAGRQHAWEGRVVRMEGQVDPASRMVLVVVEVRDPFVGRDGRPPLLPGTFVDVVIFGRTLDQVVPVPRHAVHHGRDVWVVADGRLQIREVQLARSDRTTAYVEAGLDDGERVVVSALDAVTDGMAVRAEATGSAGVGASADEAADGSEA